MKGFTRTFPYNTGTFVIVDEDENKVDINNPETLIGRLGSIACYNCVNENDNDSFLVVVSGYKSAWCGEYLLEETRLATDLEVETYKKVMGIKE